MSSGPSRRPSGCLAATLLCLAGLGMCGLFMPATSAAGTAKIENGLAFLAAPGEANRLRVTFMASGPSDQRFYGLHDSGAPITPGPGCASAGAHEVTCIGSIVRIAIDVGDGNDKVVMPVAYAPTVSFAGCGGPDYGMCPRDLTLAAQVKGGEGNDEVIGGIPFGGINDRERSSNTERLDGGPGNDRLIATGSSVHDGVVLLDGAAGNDTLGCAPTSSGCFLLGGDGADLLTDRGAGGSFVAGAGADRVRSLNASTEDVDCGPGNDLYWSDPADRIGNCEATHELDDFSAFKGLSVCGAGSPRRPCDLFRPRLFAFSHARRRGRSIVARSTGGLTRTREKPCPGRVHMRIRAGQQLLARRQSVLDRNCEWSKRYAIPIRRLPRGQRRRLAQHKPIALRASFEYPGSAALFSARTLSKRYRVRP